MAPYRFEISRRSALLMLCSAAIVGVAAAADAQLPTVPQFLREPLHTVRGSLGPEYFGVTGPRVGVELSMPTSVAVGSFDEERIHFETHSFLPRIQINWARGWSIDEIMGPLEASERHGVDYVSTRSAVAVTRGDGWVAGTWTSEYRLLSDSAGSVRYQARVLLRPASTHDLYCFGEGESEVALSEAFQIRDWLLARCRSLAVVATP